MMHDASHHMPCLTCYNSTFSLDSTTGSHSVPLFEVRRVPRCALALALALALLAELLRLVGGGTPPLPPCHGTSA